MAANITYIVHLMGVVPMLVLEVPFSKWSHLAYRPLGDLLRATATGSPSRRGHSSWQAGKATDGV